MSNLDIWRKNIVATEEIELPSGPAVIKSSVTLLDLAAAGHIPQTLLTELEELGSNPDKTGIDTFTRVMPALDAIAIAVFVDPKVTRDGGPDSLSVEEIPILDKLLLFRRSNGAAELLRPFRGQEGKSNRAAQPGNGVQPATE